MREAIGNSFLVTLSIVFLFLIMALLVSSLSYSKAYKAKNKVVSVIEKYDGFTEDAVSEIDTDLYKMGYKTNTTGRSCKEYYNEDVVLLHDTEAGKHDYCVYEVSSTRGKYYHVVTYMHFDIPVIGQYLTFEVRGDSRTIYGNGRLEG